MTLRQRNRTQAHGRGQRGIVLIIAIIVLLAMTIAAYALLRSVSSGLGIAGNIAFKQNATSVGDLGIERAIQWVTGPTVLATPTLLEADNAAEAYFASWQPGFDPMTYAWDTAGNSKAASFPAGADSGGNTVRYVIHRLCSLPGAISIANQQCVTPEAKCPTNAGTGVTPTVCPTQPYFRITARVQGPRNTVSFIQVVMY